MNAIFANNGFPFEIKRKPPEFNPYTHMTELELMEKLAIARKDALDGRYRSADSMVAETRTKYGL